MQDSPLNINPRRQADDIISAYVYQIWQTAYYWINLEEGERLYIENAEDFDVVRQKQIDTVQVKNTTASVTLNSKPILDAICHFWKHKKRNPDAEINYVYLTSSKRGREKSVEFDGIKGLDYWDNLKASSDHTGVTQIKEHLINHNYIPDDFSSYLKNIPDAEFYQEFVNKIDWLTGQQEAKNLKRKIKEKLILFGSDERECTALESEKVLAHLLLTIVELIESSSSNYLTKADFIKCFDQTNNIELPRKNYRVLSRLAAPTLSIFLETHKQLSERDAKQLAQLVLNSSQESDFEAYFEDSSLIQDLLSDNFDLSSLLEKRKKEQDVKENPSLLTYQERQALGILCTAQMEFWTVKKLGDLFPDINWSEKVEVLKGKNLISVENSIIRPHEKAEQVILSDEEEALNYHKGWTEELEKLTNYYDTNFLLALHYLSMDERKKTIQRLADGAISLDPGFWSKLYYDFLKEIYDRDWLDDLEIYLEAKFLLALALCSSHVGNLLEAKKIILQANKLSKKANDPWIVGNSLINAGSIFQKLGELEESKKYFEKARDHAEKFDDEPLLGRCLNNLGMYYLGKGENQSRKYFEKALTIKKRNNDISGIVGSYLGIGNFFASNNNYQRSIKWFTKAEELANENYLFYLKALSLINKGSSTFNLGEFKNALGFYERSLEISERETLINAKVMAYRGIANCYGELGDFDKSYKFLSELLAFQQESDLPVEEILWTKIDLGIAELKREHEECGREIFVEIIEEGRKDNLSEIVFEARKTLALSYQHDSKDLTHKKFKNFAKEEIERGNKKLAVKLFTHLGHLYIHDRFDSNEIESLLNKVIGICKENDFTEELKNLFDLYYDWKFSEERFSDAIQILENYEDEIDKESKKEVARIQDAKGICYQHLFNYDKAIECHNNSLSSLKDFESQKIQENAYNNLGEAFRKTKQYEKSLLSLSKAQNFAEYRGNKYDEYNIIYNKALTLNEKGEVKKALELLGELKEKSKHEAYHDIYIKVFYGLANIFKEQNELKLSAERFEKAYNESKEKGETTLLANIAIEYSGVLLKLQEDQKAISLLKESLSLIDKNYHHYYLYRAIARAYEETGDVENEKKFLVKSLQIAQKLNFSEKIIDTFIRLAEFSEEQSNTSDAYSYYREAIDKEEDPKWKSFIYQDLLDIMLNNNDTHKAQKIFEEAIDYCEKNDLNLSAVNLYMKVGDYNWFSNDFDQKVEALQTYLFALLQTVDEEINSEKFADVGMYIYYNILDEYEAKGKDFVINLKEEITEWLYDEIEDTLSVEKIIWPLSLVDRVSDKLEESPDLTEKEIEELIMREYSTIFNIES